MKRVIAVGLALGMVLTSGAADHPWSGKKVVFLGDSITDPAQIKRHDRHVYWEFLEKDCGIEPHVYAVSGYQWDRISPMAQRMQTEMTNSVDAILILLGTNDYNSGVPLGEWYETEERDVNRRGVTIRQPHRAFAKNMGTVRGRINTVMEYLKRNFPDQQIVLMTPLHRGKAGTGADAIPDESYPNATGAYFDAYVEDVREAGRIWSVPVLDLYAEGGFMPLYGEYARYFKDADEDMRHIGKIGHTRVAQVILRWMLSHPSSSVTMTPPLARARSLRSDPRSLSAPITSLMRSSSLSFLLMMFVYVFRSAPPPRAAAPRPQRCRSMWLWE